jgi:hypothetical protein
MIKRIIKSAFAAALAALMLASSACASRERGYTRIAGKEIYFASEAEAEKWREPLESLLSNTVGLQFEDESTGEPLPNEPPYPERPHIQKGFGGALFDLTGDGTPELLINTGGGSSVVIPYIVYDIYTGECIGELDSSGSDSVCCYYAVEAESIKTVNKYSMRLGWSEKTFYVNFIEPRDGGFAERTYLESGYEMEFEESAENEFDIVCRSVECFVWGEKREPGSFLFERELFDTEYIRIPETALRYVLWYDLPSDGDTPEEHGKKMAAALLSTGQMFIVYGE